MATINNLKGTTYQSFLIGKRGTTIYQGTGTAATTVTSPQNGDVYLQQGTGSSDQGIWQYVNSSWVQLQVTSANLSALSSITASAGTILGVATGGTSISSLTPTQVETILGLGSAAYVSTGTSAGNVPILDSTGKIPVSTLPSIAISDVYSVADTSARDALDAHEGDIAIVTSDSTTYIYDGSAWQTIGSAGSVTGIEGVNSTVKTGVVSLAASDILSGTFSVSQGGTGLISVNAGDLLVGSSDNKLTTLTSSTDGSSLIMSGGSVAWGSVDSSNVTFADSSGGLKSTNSEAAILEVASTRIKITTTTANPTASSDTTAGYKIGDIIINTSTGKIFQAISVSSGAAIWQKMGSVVKPENTLYVAVSGDDTNGDGSASYPYKTISQAITQSSTGSSILVYPGSYNEDLTISVSGVEIKSVSGNVIVGGAFTTSVDDVIIDGIDFAVISSSTPSITIGANSNIVFYNSSMDSSTTISLKGKVGTGIGFNFCEILGSVIMNSTSSNDVVFRDSYGFSTSISAGSLVVTGASSIQAIAHTGGTLYLNDVMGIVKDSNNNSIVSSAASATGNYLSITNSTLLQNDLSYGALSITGGVSYLVDNTIFDPTTILPSSGRTYGALSKDIGVQGTFTNITPGENIQTALQAIDSKLGTISSSAVTAFAGLSDVTAYKAADANMVVQVNSTGTGLSYGPVLGSAAQQATSYFATASQGNLASTAVQPSSLATVATSGKFVDLTDGPGAMGSTNASKVIRVNADGTSLEFGPTLSTVANTGSYSDLSNTPSLATVATSGKYSDLTGTPDFTNDSQEISVKSLKSDNSNIISDGAGNLNILGKLNVGEFILPSSKYAELPETPATGQLQLVTDGRKPGEAEGSGTGVLCIYDGSIWMDISSGVAVLT